MKPLPLTPARPDVDASRDRGGTADGFQQLADEAARADATPKDAGRADASPRPQGASPPAEQPTDMARELPADAARSLETPAARARALALKSRLGSAEPAATQKTKAPTRADAEAPALTPEVTAAKAKPAGRDVDESDALGRFLHDSSSRDARAPRGAEGTRPRRDDDRQQPGPGPLQVALELAGRMAGDAARPVALAGAQAGTPEDPQPGALLVEQAAGRLVDKLEPNAARESAAPPPAGVDSTAAEVKNAAEAAPAAVFEVAARVDGGSEVTAPESVAAVAQGLLDDPQLHGVIAPALARLTLTVNGEAPVHVLVRTHDGVADVRLIGAINQPVEAIESGLRAALSDSGLALGNLDARSERDPTGSQHNDRDRGAAPSSSSPLSSSSSSSAAASRSAERVVPAGARHSVRA